jgi:Cu+-exporting ATPase
MEGAVPKDPVCGMTPKADTPHRFVHAGQTYLFCSARCVEKFRADPERYLAPAAAKPAHEQIAAKYTCPMHPGGRARRPGQLPDLRHGARTDGSDRRGGYGRAARHDAAVGRERRAEPPVFALAMGGRMPWLQLALATPVVLWGGWPFFVRGWASLVSRHLNMFTLIALGTEPRGCSALALRSRPTRSRPRSATARKPARSTSNRPP